jgi:hypothetical protein
VSTTSVSGTAAGTATTFDVAVGTAAQQQNARLREFYPHVTKVEDDTYRRLMARLPV